jgi:F0F1-type ATP synthase membrane subunit c/vacuolar-type H+-ATPase subunit K
MYPTTIRKDKLMHGLRLLLAGLLLAGSAVGSSAMMVGNAWSAFVSQTSGSREALKLLDQMLGPKLPKKR